MSLEMQTPEPTLPGMGTVDSVRFLLDRDHDRGSRHSAPVSQDPKTQIQEQVGGGPAPTTTSGGQPQPRKTDFSQFVKLV